MIFVFDIDDTICDTDKYSEKYINEFFANNNLPYKQIATNVRFAEEKFNWDLDTALNWYRTYGDKMMDEFPCKPGAVETINALHDAGHKIVIATARNHNWHTNSEEITIKWLKENNIKYDKFYIDRLDKEKICEEENADIFVDDDLKIASKVAEKFSKSENKFVFLPTTNFNILYETPKNVIRINSLNEITKYIK